MLTEEKIRELYSKISEQKEQNTQTYIAISKEAEDIRKKYTALLGSLETLVDLTPTDEITEKIEKQKNEANELANAYNEKISLLQSYERQIFVSDGVMQTCLFILEDDEEE